MNARGYYGNRERGEYARALSRLAVGRELTSDEMNDALAAGERAVAPMEDERRKMMLEWKPDVPLSREQMTQIMNEALKVARETEKNLATMIDKVPSQWESMLRNERNLINNGIAEAPRFQTLIAEGVPIPDAKSDELLAKRKAQEAIMDRYKARNPFVPTKETQAYNAAAKRVQEIQAEIAAHQASLPKTPVGRPVVVPGFRDWIVIRLLRRAESGVKVIGYVAHVLPNWLRGMRILSGIYDGVVGAIRGIVRIAKAAGGAVVDVVESTAGAIKGLPTVLKVAGIAALGLGGVWAFSKLRASSTKGARA